MWIVAVFVAYILYKHFCPRPSDYDVQIKNYQVDESKLSQPAMMLNGVSQALYGALYTNYAPDVVIASLRGKTELDLNAINHYFGTKYDAVEKRYKNLPEFIESKLKGQDYNIVRDLVRGSNIILR